MVDEYALLIVVVELMDGCMHNQNEWLLFHWV
jgi:hypothetical protein